MGDLERAEKYAAQIQRQEFPSGYRSLAADLARSARAQVDRVQGRADDALKKLEPLLSESKNPLESPIVAEAYERFSRAELLYERGRYQEALTWLEHLSESSVFEFVYLPLSHLWRAETYNRLGQVQRAAASYQAFIDLWQDCDPELRPMVELARRKLEGLRGGGEQASVK